MKLLQLLENLQPFPNTKEAVEAALNKYRIKNYTINNDLSVDVDGNVNLTDRNLKSLPVKFGKVAGNFICGHNQLAALEGAPRKVSGGLLLSFKRINFITRCAKRSGRGF